MFKYVVYECQKQQWCKVRPLWNIRTNCNMFIEIDDQNNNFEAMQSPYVKHHITKS